jgi:hypothetical protein
MVAPDHGRTGVRATSSPCIPHVYLTVGGRSADKGTGLVCRLPKHSPVLQQWASAPFSWVRRAVVIGCPVVALHCTLQQCALLSRALEPLPVDRHSLRSPKSRAVCHRRSAAPNPSRAGSALAQEDSAVGRSTHAQDARPGCVCCRGCRAPGPTRRAAHGSGC